MFYIYRCTVQDREQDVTVPHVRKRFLFKSSMKKYLCDIINSGRNLTIVSSKKSWFGLGERISYISTRLNIGKSVENISSNSYYFDGHETHHFELKNRTALLSAVRNLP